ncbi:structural maintenance of chromosomes protein 4-like isoform X1 [Humulus lupulus]|uniref:structural maintenance of chromosomes protein 4-like isoform X1 n=1 Tax=Humulus lupulus TaxID=3486 RepID=UPI002B403975|nr:structural maintenance of chromosomes protein 4-like isoform X1 [Humulus lupulus]
MPFDASCYFRSCAKQFLTVGIISPCNPPTVSSNVHTRNCVEIERHCSELAKVGVELEPWEKQLIEHKGKLEVASTENKLLSEKEAARAAFEDAEKQMEDILGAIETKSESITKIQSDLERSKLEALEAHKVEQVRVLMMYREGLGRDGGWVWGWLVGFSTSWRQHVYLYVVLNFSLVMLWS